MKASSHTFLGIGTALATVMPAMAVYYQLGDIRVGIYDQNTTSSSAPHQGLAHSRVLDPAETRSEIRLAYNLWQSILPDMNWRFATSHGEENMTLTFRDYSGGGGSGLGDNIVLNAVSMAGRDITYIDNRTEDQFMSWVYNPASTHWKRIDGTGSCTTLGAPNAAAKVGIDDGCFSFPSYPHWADLYGSDMAALVEHEIGHNFMEPRDFTPFPDGITWFLRPGDSFNQHDHTQPNGVTLNDVDIFWPTYQPGSQWMRRPIYDPQYLTRRQQDGFSVMWMGNSLDHSAIRGIFAVDAHELANEGNRVTYPDIAGAVVLRKGKTGAYYVTSNWKEATDLMIWPNKGGPVTDVEASSMYFITDVFPRSQTHKTFVAGEKHNLAIRENGSLWAWGANDHGQLGDGTTNTTATPKQISSGPWVAVAAGLDFSLAIKSDGTLWAWGDDSQGQIGDGGTANVLTPKQVPGNNWLAVSAGGLHVLALKKDGHVYSWGYNAEAELGLGHTTTPIRTPTQVCPTSSSAYPCEQAVFVSVSGGSNHSLALDMNGAIWGWGSNANSQLTSVVGGMALRPTLISSVSGSGERWSQVEAGFLHSVGLSSGLVFTWGDNQYSELGNCSTGGTTSWPTNVCSSTNDWASIFSSSVNIGGVRLETNSSLTNRRFFSWGGNSDGQIGDGTTNATSYGTWENTGTTTWVQGSGRQNHTLGLLKDGTLWGWGANSWGEAGTGAPGSDILTPTKSKFTENTISGSWTAYQASPTVTNVNLTSVGTINWVKWNSSSAPNSKKTEPIEKQYRFLESIPTYEFINAASVGTFSNNVVKFSWTNTDEINGASGSNLATGVFIAGTSSGRGFRITIPARQAQKTLKLYVGAYRVQGKLVAKYSDGSAASYTNTSLNSPGTATTHSNGMYSITFTSMNPDANLIVEWTVNSENTTSGSRFVTLQAATVN